jgi:hypothetical protein
MQTIGEICRALLTRQQRPTIPEVRTIVKFWYERPRNGAGGELHVILDDNNREHGFLIDGANRLDASEDARLICQVLLRMTPSQRRRL